MNYYSFYKWPLQRKFSVSLHYGEHYLFIYKYVATAARVIPHPDSKHWYEIAIALAEGTERVGLQHHFCISTVCICQSYYLQSIANGEKKCHEESTKIILF